MQLIQAGKHQFVVLEFDHDLLRQGAQETGFEIEIDDQPRVLNVLLRAPGRDSPLLLFDASDPANTGWFSLIVALMCIPFGSLLLALGVAKWLRNRRLKREIGHGKFG